MRETAKVTTEGKMTLKAFTSNFDDNSTDAGFQFTFFCDACHEGYKTGFIEAKSYKKGRFFKGLGGIIGTAAQMTGQFSNIGYGAERGADILSEKFEGMTPEWHKEHEQAFSLAQNEAQGHFHRCPRCKKYFCDNDWNDEAGLCVEEAPRESTEVAAARAEKMVQDIKAKASETNVFTGKIEQRQTLCPQCNKPTGEGKFCNNCGAKLNATKCPSCGSPIPQGSKFCGECGSRI
jgi:hypothetical protein